MRFREFAPPVPVGVSPRGVWFGVYVHGLSKRHWQTGVFGPDGNRPLGSTSLVVLGVVSEGEAYVLRRETVAYDPFGEDWRSWFGSLRDGYRPTPASAFDVEKIGLAVDDDVEGMSGFIRTLSDDAPVSLFAPADRGWVSGRRVWPLLDSVDNGTGEQVLRPYNGIGPQLLASVRNGSHEADSRFWLAACVARSTLLRKNHSDRWETAA